VPYEKSNLPDRIKGLPDHAQAIWIAAFNNAIEEYKGDEGKANATAWSAVKKAGYEQDAKGEWHKKFGEGGMDFNQPIEIFRVGDYPQGKYTTKDLDEIVANFNPEVHEPPLVIDHAETGPAYGWIERIWREGDSLWAKLKNLTKDIKEKIKEGEYKKISIMLWENFDNTAKKVLKHVSLLGAGIPQVKGLKTFSDVHGLYRCITFEDDVNSEFAATEEDKKVQKIRSTKYGITIREDGNVTKPSEWANVPDEQWADPVNYAYPCPNYDQTVAALRYWGKSENQSKYSMEDKTTITKRLLSFAKKYKVESQTKQSEMKEAQTTIEEFIETNGGQEMTQEEIQKLIDSTVEAKTKEFTEKVNVLTDENKKLKEDADLTTKKMSERELNTQRVEIKAFCENLKSKGQIIPAWLDMGMLKFMESLDSQNVSKFSEADSSKEISPYAWFRLFLESLPKVVEFKELAKDKDGNLQVESKFFVVADTNAHLPIKNDELAEKAVQFMESNKDKKLTFKEALIEVSRRDK
jgi:cation transport regulator ChaB